MAVRAILLVLESVPVMVAALVPDAPPEIEVPVGTAHVYVVPVGTIPLVTSVGATGANAMPLQVVPVKALIIALGFNVTVTVNGDPVQEPDKVVIV